MAGPDRMLEVLPERGRDAVLRAARPRKFTAGDSLFHAGDEGSSLHIVSLGRVAVRITTPQGDRLTLAVMGPGEVLGEIALFQPNHERSATVTALEPVETLTLRRDAFDVLRGEHPEVNDFLLQVLAARVDRLSGLVSEAHFVPVEKRVGRRVWEVGRYYLGDALPVVVPLTQDDVAGLAGTTRPTANAALQKLVGLGFLRLGRGRIDLLDPRGLRTWAW